MPCSQTPGMPHISAHYRHMRYCFLINRHHQPFQQLTLRGSITSAHGLRPATSLSTLNPCRYRHVLKTRYGMRWVNAFPMELSSTSSIGASWRTGYSHQIASPKNNILFPLVLMFCLLCATVFYGI